MFFTNSGAEACEGAIKLARRYHFANGHPERWRIITFKGAFHGRTLATIAAGGNAKYLEGFGEPAPASIMVAFGDLEALRRRSAPDRRHHGRAGAGRGRRARRLEPSSCKGLRELCDEHGLLLVLDEVQMRHGPHRQAVRLRVGGRHARRDGGGQGHRRRLPGRLLHGHRRSGQGHGPGTHGSTYGGNPLAMAVGNAVLDAVLEPGFLDQVRDTGLRLKQELARVKDENPDVVEEVRGSGCWPASRSSRHGRGGGRLHG